MKEIAIEIAKKGVYESVAILTAYIGDKGSKVDDKEDLYAKTFTTDADRDFLERYWVEACTETTAFLRDFIKSVTGIANTAPIIDLSETYTATLGVSDRFNDAQTDSVIKNIRSFIVEYITSNWLNPINEDNAKNHMDIAVLHMKGALAMLYKKDEPTRIIPEDIIHDDELVEEGGTTP